MECVTKFNDFISEISLTDDMTHELSKAYKLLKSNLNSHVISKDIIGMFLQGSYARGTGVKPITQEDKLDVDLVVVTRFDCRKVTPKQALEAFEPFLNTYYEGKWRYQGRSIGIKLETCDIDLVPTALPSKTVERFVNEAFNSNEYAETFFRADSTLNTIKKFSKEDEIWKDEPLKIPDTDAGAWDDTHPMAQIIWTQEKNSETGGEYIHLVRALKWWKKNFCVNADSIKSYPLEHFIGSNCPSVKKSLAALIVETLVNIVKYNGGDEKPRLPDHGVPQHDVFAKVTNEDFKNFMMQVRKIAQCAVEALEEPDPYNSSVKWRKIFGDKFPLYDKPSPKFTSREEPSSPSKPSRYA